MRLYLLSLYLLVYFLLEVVPLGVAPLGRAFLPGSLMAQSPVPPVSSSTSPTEPLAQKGNPGNDSSPLKDSANSSSPKQTTLDQELAALQAVLDQLLKQQSQANVPVDQEKLEKESAPLLEKLVRTKLQRPQSWQHLPGESSDASEEALPASNPSDPSTRYNLKGNFYPGNSPRIVPIQPLPQNANPAIVPLSSAKAQGANPTGRNFPTNPTFSPNPSSGGTASSGTPGQTPPSSFSLPGFPKASSGQNAGGSVENEGRSAYFLRQSALQQLTNIWYDDKEGFFALCLQLSEIFGAPCKSFLSFYFPPGSPKISIATPSRVSGSGLILDNFYDPESRVAKWLKGNPASYPDASKVFSTLASFETLSEQIVRSRPFEDLRSATQVKSREEVFATIKKIKEDLQAHVEKLKKFKGAGHSASLSPEQWKNTLSKFLPLLNYDQRKKLIQRLRLGCQGQASSAVCGILDGVELIPSMGQKQGRSAPLAFLSGQISSLSQFLSADELPGFMDALSDAWSVNRTNPFSDGAQISMTYLKDNDDSFLSTSLATLSITNNLIKQGCLKEQDTSQIPLPQEERVQRFFQDLSLSDWDNFEQPAILKQAWDAYGHFFKEGIDPVLLGIFRDFSSNNRNYTFLTQGQRQKAVALLLRGHVVASHAYSDYELWFGSLLDTASKDNLFFDPCIVSMLDLVYQHLFNYFGVDESKEEIEKRIQSTLKSDLSPPTFQTFGKFLKLKSLITPLNHVLETLPSHPPLLGEVDAICTQWKWDSTQDPNCNSFTPPPAGCPTSPGMLQQLCIECTMGVDCQGVSGHYSGCVCSGHGAIVANIGVNASTLVGFLTPADNLFRAAASPSSFSCAYSMTKTFPLPSDGFQKLLQYTTTHFQEEWLQLRFLHDALLCADPSFETTSMGKKFASTLEDFLQSYNRVYCPLIHPYRPAESNEWDGADWDFFGCGKSCVTHNVFFPYVPMLFQETAVDDFISLLGSHKVQELAQELYEIQSGQGEPVGECTSDWFNHAGQKWSLSDEARTALCARIGAVLAGKQ